MDSSSGVDMSKNHKVHNRYSSHVLNRVSTVPPNVAGSQKTMSLGFTKKIRGCQTSYSRDKANL